MLSKKELIDGFEQLENMFKSDIKDINKFTDDFLKSLILYQEKVKNTLDGKTIEEIKSILDKNTDKKIKRAVEYILNNSSLPEEQDIGYSLFLPGESNINGLESSKVEIKTVEKYREFLRAFREVFFGNKDVSIKVKPESLDKSKMRKIPYRIIHFYGNGHNKTFLISNQVGEATFVYDGIIDEDNFKNIKKGEQINGINPKKIIYSKNYSQELKKHLKNEKVEDSKEYSKIDIKTNPKADLSDYEQEKATFDEIYYKTIFNSITDRDGNKKQVDLNNIGMNEFKKLYFGRGTKFGQISGQTLLKYNGGNSSISLKKVLTLLGIKRDDLPDEEIDYNNSEHIKAIFSSITDKTGNKIETNLNNIGVDEFKKLYFGRGTKFGQITGNTLLINNLGLNIISFKKVLALGLIQRDDLPDEEIDHKNLVHIKTIFTSITDKYGNKIKVDLNTVLMKAFSNLHFGRGTKFGQIRGKVLLLNNLGQNNISLKKVLVLGGIQREDLPDEEIDYKNSEHIKTIFTSITDKDGNVVKVDLNSVGMNEFRKLYFGRGTKFGQINGYTLIESNLLINIIGLKKVLALGGIQRDDLPDEEIDDKNPEHIKTIFTSITDKDGNKIEADLKTIGMTNFKNLWFGRGTRFGQITGKTLLTSNGGQTSISLKKVLALGGIKRDDL